MSITSGSSLKICVVSARMQRWQQRVLWLQKMVSQFSVQIWCQGPKQMASGRSVNRLERAIVIMWGSLFRLGLRNRRETNSHTPCSSCKQLASFLLSTLVLLSLVFFISDCRTLPVTAHYAKPIPFSKPINEYPILRTVDRLYQNPVHKISFWSHDSHTKCQNHSRQYTCHSLCWNISLVGSCFMQNQQALGLFFKIFCSQAK